ASEKASSEAAGSAVVSAGPSSMPVQCQTGQALSVATQALAGGNAPLDSTGACIGTTHQSATWQSSGVSAAGANARAGTNFSAAS
ncbi:hypothetical protein ACSTJS_24705, partial [Vibrio parahaemolyticus]